MPEPPRDAGWVRVARTGIALVHEGEMIRAAPDSDAVLEDAGAPAAVHYHFPVEIEVLQPLELGDAESVAEVALRRLADGLEA
jgi:hypothetical protein